MVILGAFIFCIVTVTICFLCGISKGEKKAKTFRKTETGNVCVADRDSLKATEQISMFLDRRKWVCRWNVCHTQMIRQANGSYRRTCLNPLENRFNGNCYINKVSLYSLVRLCHFLGCDITFRQVGSSKDSDNGEYILTHMKERLRNTSIDITYPYNKKNLDTYSYV